MNYKPKSIYFPISLNGLEYDSPTGNQIDRAQIYFNFLRETVAVVIYRLISKGVLSIQLNK